MDNNARRRLLIALKSPVQAVVDTRPRCEDCGDVLSHRDLTSYWDGQGDLLGFPTPRCCEDCAERQEAS